MKKINLLCLCAILFLSCSTEDQPSSENSNKAPSQPQLQAPENDLFCTTDVQIFEWKEVNDPEEDEVIYILEISTTEDFKQLFFSDETGDTSTTVSLEKGKSYYWRVTAKDINGNKSPFSGKRRLYTEGEASSNYLPGAPSLISPEEAATVTGISVKLEWEAEDLDGDELTYDLYFGKTTDLELIAENVHTSFYEVEIEANNSYYWKVVVKDEHNAKTTGKTWSFHLK